MRWSPWIENKVHARLTHAEMFLECAGNRDGVGVHIGARLVEYEGVYIVSWVAFVASEELRMLHGGGGFGGVVQSGTSCDLGVGLVAARVCTERAMRDVASMLVTARVVKRAPLSKGLN